MSVAAVDREHLERRPGLHGRVHVAEIPLVGGQRAVRMLEPLPAEQDQLVLGERGIEVRQRDAVEGQVPGGEPGVLPLVRHGHDVEGVEAAPAAVPAGQPLFGRRRLARVTVQPAADVVVVQLLAPEHPGEGLAHDHRLVGAGTSRGQLGVELVGLGLAQCEHLVEASAQRVRLISRSRRAQPQPKFGRLASVEPQPVPGGALGAGSRRVDGRRSADHVIPDAVLGIRGNRLSRVQQRGVGLVIAEKQFRQPAVGPVPASSSRSPTNGWLRLTRALAGPGLRAGRRRGGEHRPGRVLLPGPRVAVPGGGQHVQRGGLGPGVGHADPDQQVVRACLGVVDLDDPVPVCRRRRRCRAARIQGRVRPRLRVLTDQLGIGEAACG